MTSLRRFFVSPHDITDTITIRGEDVQHIRTVLRLSAGDTIEVFDGIGNRYDVQLTALDKREAKGRILCTYDKEQKGTTITLGQGIPKSRKMDFIIQKATELGVDTIVPLITARTVVKLEERSLVKKRTLAENRL